MEMCLTATPGSARIVDLGMYDYGPRFYDPALGRWLQPDTIIPNPYDPGSWDRYAYVSNNSLTYTDPTGHMMRDDTSGGCGLPSCEMKPSATKPPKPDLTSKTPKSTPITEFPFTFPGNKPKNQCGIKYACVLPWKQPRWWDMDPRNPDYITFSGSIGEGAGATVTLIMDRYGNIYI